MRSRCSHQLPIGAMPGSVRARRSPSCHTTQSESHVDTMPRKGPVGAAPGAWPRPPRKLSDAPSVGSSTDGASGDDVTTSVLVMNAAPKPGSEAVKSTHAMEQKYEAGDTTAEGETTPQIDTSTPSLTEVLEDVGCLESLETREKVGLSLKTKSFEGSSRSTSPGCSTSAQSSPTFSYAEALNLEPMYVLWESTCIFGGAKHVAMPEPVSDVQGPVVVQLVGTPQTAQDFDLTPPPGVFYDPKVNAARTRTWSGASDATQPPCDAVLASVGSMHHFKGTCKPCAFVHTVGCVNGDRCFHCHLCSPGEKLRRRHLKRAAKQLRQ